MNSFGARDLKGQPSSSPVERLYQQQRPEYTERVIIFGHRGAPGYPRHAENTIWSFKKALRGGATGLEFDVRRCADGRLVVIHDETIDRTTTRSEERRVGKE